jgi:hypothetical protein
VFGEEPVNFLDPFFVFVFLLDSLCPGVIGHGVYYTGFFYVLLPSLSFMRFYT